MMWFPESLREEEDKLVEEFFAQYSEEEMQEEMTEEDEVAFDEYMRSWLYEHASELLRLYWNYRDWVGGEGQLCDGKGNYIISNKEHGCTTIHFWDVNEDGFCVYEGTDELILNTDGSPIKDPVLDKRVEMLDFEDEEEYNAYCKELEEERELNRVLKELRIRIGRM